jgi:hypothetical protein
VPTSAKNNLPKLSLGACSVPKQYWRNGRTKFLR